jgi:hypothetical protein
MSEIARKLQTFGLVRSLRSEIQKQAKSDRRLEEFAPKTGRVRAESHRQLMVTAEKPHRKQFTRRVFDAVFSFRMSESNEFHASQFASDARNLKDTILRFDDLEFKNYFSRTAISRIFIGIFFR